MAESAAIEAAVRAGIDLGLVDDNLRLTHEQRWICGCNRDRRATHPRRKCERKDHERNELEFSIHWNSPGNGAQRAAGGYRFDRVDPAAKPVTGSVARVRSRS